MNVKEWSGVELGCAVVLFAALTGMVWQLFIHLAREQILQRKLLGLFRQIDRNARKRDDLLQEKILLEGEMEEDNLDLLMKLDRLIRQSGIGKRLPFLNGEWFLILSIALSGSMILFGIILFHRAVTGILTAVLSLLLVLIFLLLMRSSGYNRIENEVIDFINLMENYSRTTEDLIDIFGKVYPYLREPLQSLTRNCYLEGVRTGSTSMALFHLEHGLQHRKLREIIHNLAVCSRYDTNYRKVIADSRSMLQEYLAGKEQRRAILANGRIEYLSITAISVFLLWMLDDFVGQDTWDTLIHTAAGHVFLGYFAVCVLFAVIGLFIREGARD